MYPQKDLLLNRIYFKIQLQNLITLQPIKLPKRHLASLLLGKQELVDF